MSAFAWLISFAPLSVGSGQCLVFFPDCFSVHVVSDVHEGFLGIPLKMAPRKGFSTFSRVVSEGLSDQSYWLTFPEAFCRIESSKLRLLDGRPFVNKKNSSAFEVVCSSFGLVSVILRKKTGSEE